MPGEVFQKFQSDDMYDLCSRDEVAMLFRESASESSFHLVSVLFTSAKRALPRGNNGTTEASFHSLWDDHIRNILTLLLPNGESIRDSCVNTSTQKLRPDFGFLLNNVCVFRGEETSPSSNDEDPKAELCGKLTWIYSPAPYIFGVPITSLCDDSCAG